MGYKVSKSIDNALHNMATTYPTTCTMFYLSYASWQQVNIPAVRISAGPNSLPAVLFTGGVHARELVPPDALLSFCSNLLHAHATGAGISYPSFTDLSGTNYGPYLVDKSAVAAIMQNFSLFVVPCVNPDGRNFVLAGSDKLHKQWRKNRRPDASCPGVDINRNFPFVWDANVYYAPSVVPTVDTSTNSCDQNFRGYTQAPVLNPSIEPETQSLIDLVLIQAVEYVVDVHMSGRTVLYPWGMEIDQSTDSTQTSDNTDYNYQRDGPQGTIYGEYLPNSASDPRGQLLDKLTQLAAAMVAEIRKSAGPDPTAIARSTYTPQQSVGLYPTTGAFDDYTFGQQFANPSLATTCAFTLACGFEGGKPNDPADGDGGFAPDFNTQYPKVEREVHAALFGLLNAI